MNERCFVERLKAKLAKLLLHRFTADSGLVLQLWSQFFSHPS